MNQSTTNKFILKFKMNDETHTSQACVETLGRDGIIGIRLNKTQNTEDNCRIQIHYSMAVAFAQAIINKAVDYYEL